MSRATTLHLNLEALTHNLQRVQSAAPSCRIAAAVKANGYGHGLRRVATALADADAFAVASLEEALELRDAAMQQRIILLEGVYEASELSECATQALDIALHHLDQVRMLECTHLERPLRVWLKIDTGMHRLGLDVGLVPAIFERLLQCAAVAPAIGFMSHLACADERDSAATVQQLQLFQQATADLPGARSLANSAGILRWPSTHFDWVRPGIMLYGASPFPDTVAADEGLRPVMTLSTRLIAIKRLRAGDAVGYGGTWTCPEDMMVGVAAVGYGDGYPRHVPSGTPVLVNGREAALLGRVSMDMISVDLRQHPDANIGDPVVLWGEGLPIERIAKAATTIPYTLTCGITERVRRVVAASDIPSNA